MMSISALVKKALDCNEMIECFLGEGKYNTSNRMDPSNISENRILLGIQELFNNNEILVEQVVDTIIKMMDLGPDEYFIAFGYVAYYLDLKSRNKISYTLDINYLAIYSTKKFVEYTQNLKVINEIDRISFRGNAYDQIVKTNEILKKNFGTDLLAKKNSNEVKSNVPQIKAKV